MLELPLKTDFFTNENGIHFGFGSSLDADGHQFMDDPPLLTRTTTIASTWSVSESDVIGIKLEIGELAELIRSHSSLQRTEIVSTEGYKQTRNAILHRFLILELRRADKHPVWLRMDRRMYPDANRVSFLLESFQSPAYDTVSTLVSIFFEFH